jgi:hypothetical protein
LGVGCPTSGCHERNEDELGNDEVVFGVVQDEGKGWENGGVLPIYIRKYLNSTTDRRQNGPQIMLSKSWYQIVQILFEQHSTISLTTTSGWNKAEPRAHMQ